VKITGALTSSPVVPVPESLSSYVADPLIDSSDIMPNPLPYVSCDSLDSMGILSQEEEKELSSFLIDAEDWL